MSKLATIRKRKGITQWRLAELVGVHETTVSQWETGRQFPEKKHLDAIAAILGCKVSELMDDE